MTNAACYSLFVLLVAIVLWWTHRIAYNRGVDRGKDEEWLRAFFEKVEADKARRGPDGKYKKKETI